VRPDDRNLSPEQRAEVESRALKLLHRADAWGHIPVPVEDILSAARLRVAPYSVFHPRAIAAYAKAQGEKAAKLIKQAASKIFGILDTAEEVIHIDDTVTEGKQIFLKFHETGHHELPHQRKIFRFFEESEDELDPGVADLFEREANNFARFIIFNGHLFRDRAAEHQLSFGSVKKLQRQFKVSLYAALREYTRTHRLCCFALCCEKPTFCPQSGFSCDVRRIEVSPLFESQFGVPTLEVIAGGHRLADLVPFGRRATRPTEFTLTDKNGQTREFIGEALDTTYHVLIFACLRADFQS
jgi:Zn-dependent peptidase ImmA (M78 family)